LNTKKAQVLVPGNAIGNGGLAAKQTTERQWSDIKVGDLVKIDKD
jgi:hypothetical protein